MEKQNRFRSWALWVSVAGLIFLLLTKVFGLDINLQLWDEVLTAIGTILIGFGILNNPTSKNSL
jgi:phi LC3 family holin